MSRSTTNARRRSIAFPDFGTEVLARCLCRSPRASFPGSTMDDCGNANLTRSVQNDTCEARTRARDYFYGTKGLHISMSTKEWRWHKDFIFSWAACPEQGWRCDEQISTLEYIQSNTKCSKWHVWSEGTSTSMSTSTGLFLWDKGPTYKHVHKKMEVTQGFHIFLGCPPGKKLEV